MNSNWILIGEIRGSPRQPNEAWAVRYHPGYHVAIQFLEQSLKDRTKKERTRKDARKEAKQIRKRELQRAKELAEERAQHIAGQAHSEKRLRRLLSRLVVVLMGPMEAASLAFNQYRIAEKESSLAASLRLVNESDVHFRPA